MGNLMRRTALVLLGFLGLALVALVVVSPNLQFGGTTTVITNRLVTGQTMGGGSLEQAQRIAELEAEIERLKEGLAQAQAAKSGSVAASSGVALPSIRINDQKDQDQVVKIDLMNFLGVQSYFAGVSWDPYKCVPPLKTVWPDMDDATVREIQLKMKEDLRRELAAVKGVDVSQIDTEKPYHYMSNSIDDHLLGRDEKFPLWRDKIIIVLSKYMPAVSKNMILTCKHVAPHLTVEPKDLGTDKVDCTKELEAKVILEYLGYYALPYESIGSIVHGFTSVGLCTAQVRNHRKSYADWLNKERIYNPKWMTFSVQTPEQDAVVLLFDVLYEKLAVFTRQYWLGVITMQNPFDMYSIQDIIFSTQPDLLIETGTANGGSALLWSSVMELCGLEDSKIITVDLQSPVWEKGTHWGGKAREDPTQNKMWKKRVTFMKGDTVDAGIVAKIKAAAQGKKVLVTLDSGHHREHVFKELEAYCPLVSVGSYCIVEDTKMSRWSADGPLSSVFTFMEKHPEFEVDRSRELLYTHHVSGYIRRIK
mmetsp:Transcript_1096/g.2385  ORF Transcript_1096/g.2385 Transcript_1096/m.2385 type:complete len:534 (-) Transcript_1096:676-2277(-)